MIVNFNFKEFFILFKNFIFLERSKRNVLNNGESEEFFSVFFLKPSIRVLKKIQNRVLKNKKYMLKLLKT